ncbi:unnamed protein product [Nyctereutes procyonoides]|uniref:(raccoon dog) hypothetical protein n=1 Tax=Nyctereutes procyonoides TaxID=34880 RepID=A0A811XXL8_NYCPR|nr:unnamed protein product [Nyctereutes procyonoides]
MPFVCTPSFLHQLPPCKPIALMLLLLLTLQAAASSHPLIRNHLPFKWFSKESRGSHPYIR